jgi:hypothetical protein
MCIYVVYLVRHSSPHAEPDERFGPGTHKDSFKAAASSELRTGMYRTDPGRCIRDMSVVSRYVRGCDVFSESLFQPRLPLVRAQAQAQTLS